MRLGRRSAWLLGSGCLVIAVATGPAIGQNDAPESLLPPGFSQPAPAPAAPVPPAPVRPAPASPANGQNATPTPSTPRPVPGSTAGGTPPLTAPLPSSIGDASAASNSVAAADDQGDVLEDTLDSRLAAAASLPARSQQSLKSIGVMTPEMGGFAADALGRANGPYLAALMQRTNGRLVSRWGTILLRRALISRLDTPANLNGADFAAARASLLMRMGDADQARRIVQTVASENYSSRLFDVALQTYLVSADPAGICPAIPLVPASKNAPQWTMMKAICASFSGNQSTATAQIDRAIRQSIAEPIDLRLAEKAVGAGINGRRAVTIEWEDVESLSRWRFGLALATGLEPPDALYAKSGRAYQAWRARAPMVPLSSRMAGADLSAAMGIMSHAQMVDLYSAVYDDAASGDDLRARATLLRSAYVQRSPADRLAAMKALWTRSENPFIEYSSHILTAAAAARYPVSDLAAQDSDQLIASMISAGLDRSAMRWLNSVETGSLGWALIALSAPGRNGALSASDIDSFVDNDVSDKGLKGQFFVAGMAGLGRISADDRASFDSSMGLRLERNSRWTKAISAAGKRKDPALVAILAAAGMQGNNWSNMTPLHLYHIVSALNAAGLNAEARMIAAEAVARS